MGKPLGWLAVVGALALATSLLSAPAQASEEAPRVFAASEACDPGGATTGVAYAAGRVVSDGIPVGSVRVYAYDLETGSMTCVLTEADGTYIAPLLGVADESGTRRSAEGWVIAASAPDGSPLGGTSRTLAWDATELGGAVAMADLSLSPATLSVRATIDNQAVDAPTLICAGFRYSQWAGPCAVVPAGSTAPVAMATGTASEQSVYAQANVSGAWWRTWTSSGTPGTPLIVPLEPEVARASEPCSEGQPVRGVVSRAVDGDVTGLAADVVAYALSNTSAGPMRAYVGETTSDRNGEFTLCAYFDQVPGGVAGTQLVLVANSVLGGIKTVTVMSGACTAGCSGEDIRLLDSADIGGAATYAGASGQAAQAAFAAWRTAAGYLDRGNPMYSYEVASGLTGPDGRWGIAFADGLNPVPNGSYIASVTPPNTRDGYTESHVEFTSTNSRASVDIAVVRGNLVGQALAADGSPLAWSWLTVDQQECSSMCAYRGAETDSQGWFALNLPDGTYKARAYAPWGSPGSVTTTVPLVISGGVLVSFNGAPPTDPLTFRLQEPNARILVRADGVALEGTQLSIRSWNEDGYLDWYGDGNTANSGVAGVLLDAGQYVVVINHWGEEFVPSTIQHWRVTGSGSGIAIDVCPMSGRIFSEPCPAGSTSTPLARNAEGEWIVDMPTANLVATVQSPDGDADLPNAGVCLAQEVTDQWGTWTEYLSCSATNASGQVPLFLPPSGTYEVLVNPPWDTQEDWVSSKFRFQVAQDGSVCSLASDESCIALGGAAVSLPLSGPNVIASVNSASGVPLSGGWVSVQSSCNNFPGCREWVTSASVSPTGRVSLKLDASDDTYYLTVNPWNTIDGSVATTFEVRIVDVSVVQRISLQLKLPNVTGVVVDSTSSPLAYANVQVEQSTAFGWSWVNAYSQTSPSGEYQLLLDPGTYRLRVTPQQSDRSRAVATTSSNFTVTSSAVSLDITMGAPNLRGVVELADGNGVASAWIEVQEWFPAYGYYGWSDQVPGADSGTGGAFSLNLPDGQWRLIVNPPWGTLNASRTIVPVRSDGAGVCLDTSPSTACTSDRYLPATFAITMEAPNVSGQVLMPDGVTTLSYSWIEVRKWTGSAFSWDFDLPSVVTGPRATFALKLPVGRWQLIAHPDSGVVGATRTPVDVTVDAGGVCMTQDAPCGPSDAVAVGDFDIVLRPPNVNGIVTAGGTPVANAWIQAERWNAGSASWEWVNNYAWSPYTGRYSLAILDEGDYRLRSYSSQGTRGFTEGYTYLRVVSGQICELAGSPEQGASPACVGSGALDDSVSVTTALTPANLVAVISGDGQPVPWTWVQVQEQVDGIWNWRNGNHTIADGSVSLNVQVDDTALFRLRIDPPWGTEVDYVRTFAQFVAYVDGATTRTCELSNWNPITSACSTPVASAAPLAVELNVGGLRGRVTTPDESTGVTSSWIQVQQWTELPWNPGAYGWFWVDAYGYSRQQGNFTLPLDQAGIYQITAYPSWPNPLGWSRRSMIVQFDGAGSWCQQDAIVGSGPASDFGACDYAPGLTNERLVMPLASSNMVGVVLFDDTVDGAFTSRPMPFAWIEVRKSTGEWVASLSTSDQGRFAVFLEDGVYSVTAYPNWTFSQRPPLTKSVTVSGGVVTSGLSGGELVLDLDAVPPNVILTLTGVTGQRLIAVHRDANDDTSSVDWTLMSSYASSTEGGSPNQAGFILPAGVYRLSLVPDIGKVISSGGVIEVVVPASGVVNVSMTAVETDDPGASS